MKMSYFLNICCCYKVNKINDPLPVAKIYCLSFVIVDIYKIHIS